MKRLLIVLGALAVVALWGGVAAAGEYHTSTTLLCYDCHTMHYSQQHGFAGGSVASTPAAGGDWLGSSGPNHFLLKMPANDLCLQCHDGQSFAPDVVGVNANAAPTQGRQAGALNTTAGSSPYETWKGHTLGSTATPPGYDPVKIGLAADWYNAANGLECINCHTQHGRAGVYRNLGPRSLSGTGIPSYVIGTSNDTTKDVWINITSPYVAGSGNAATFNPLFDRANINFNRIETTKGTLNSSNAMGTFCAACHANFHGSPGNATVGGEGTPPEGFIRHPTAGVSIGALSGGHSSLSRFVAATTRVKVATNDYTAFTSSSPICVTCHKAHGNQNPFGLVFLNRAATAVDEEGGLGSGQTASLQTGMRNLCGQCHGQGN